MSKIPKPQKCEKKIYTQTEFEKVLNKSVLAVSKQSTMIFMAAFALSLHRELHLEPQVIRDTMQAAARIACEALCYEDVYEEVSKEIGTDVTDLLRDEMLEI